METVIERGNYTFRSTVDASPPRSITPHGRRIHISRFRFEIPLVVLRVNLRCFSARPRNNGYGTGRGVVKAYDFPLFFFSTDREIRVIRFSRLSLRGEKIFKKKKYTIKIQYKIRENVFLLCQYTYNNVLRRLSGDTVSFVYIQSDL